MKPAISILLILVLPAILFGQGSINNTIGSGGAFTVKDASNTFLTLSQSTGNVSLSRSLVLQVATASGFGMIMKGNDRFIHDYQATGTTGNNTFVGLGSGSFSLSGSEGQSSYNTGVGAHALQSLTTGSNNSSFGFYSLGANSTGNANCAFGNNALYSNGSADQNSAFGNNSLFWNTTGGLNSAFGSGTLVNNTTGGGNSAFGYNALNNSTADSNTAVGSLAGYNITSGGNNTCVGYNAQVPSATSSNQVRIGDANVIYAGVQVSWTVVSDKRSKSDITSSNLGLAFISDLRPVSYVRTNDPKRSVEYGFIAQEIESALTEARVERPGMITVDDDGRYELRYNDLLAPMVKAIQELKAQNDALKAELHALKASLTHVDR